MQNEENFTGMRCSGRGSLEKAGDRREGGAVLPKLGEQAMLGRPAQKLAQKSRRDQHVTFKPQFHCTLSFDLGQLSHVEPQCHNLW